MYFQRSWSLGNLIFLLLVLTLGTCAQNDIAVIEFSSGSRTFRQQVVITSDSIVTIEENFRTDTGPVVERRKIKSAEWESLLTTLKGVKPRDIKDLKSPGDKRTYDAASHGSIILTTTTGETFAHGFDDTEPNQKLAALMERILSLQ